MYEVMSLDGNHWYVLFLIMYYGGKSGRAVRGFQINTERTKTEGRFLRGVNTRLDTFPAGLYDAAAELARRVFGMPLVDQELRKLDVSPPRRPETHNHLIQTICSSVEGWQGTRAPSRRIRFKWSPMKDMENESIISLTFAMFPNGQVHVTCEEFPRFQSE